MIPDLELENHIEYKGRLNTIVAENLSRITKIKITDDRTQKILFNGDVILKQYDNWDTVGSCVINYRYLFASSNNTKENSTDIFLVVDNDNIIIRLSLDHQTMNDKGQCVIRYMTDSHYIYTNDDTKTLRDLYNIEFS